jgi:hypothetical protein
MTDIHYQPIGRRSPCAVWLWASLAVHLIAIASTVAWVLVEVYWFEYGSGYPWYLKLWRSDALAVLPGGVGLFCLVLGLVRRPKAWLAAAAIVAFALHWPICIALRVGLAISRFPVPS